MKLISWNVNGIRAALKKGFMEFFDRVEADIFCIQETKCQQGQVDLVLDGYHQYWHYAKKKGYSGTAVFSKQEPIAVTYGIGQQVFDDEGRVITLEYPDFYLLNCYTPNSKRGLERLEERMEFEDFLRQYMVQLNQKKAVILCGDLNVAHEEIDLKNPKTNRMSAGFTDDERRKMTTLLEAEFVDSFRYFYPEAVEQYSWWSYMGKARENNTGWRIDYFIVSQDFRNKMLDAKIHMDVYGSDHCPVELELVE